MSAHCKRINISVGKPQTRTANFPVLFFAYNSPSNYLLETAQSKRDLVSRGVIIIDCLTLYQSSFD